MPEMRRLEGRNGTIWRAHIRGATQAELAAKYGISQSTVSAIIRNVAESISPTARDELIASEIDYLRDLRRSVLTLYSDDDGTPTLGAPVTAGKDGDILVDPKTKEVVRDHTGRLAALKAAMDITKVLHRVTGLDVPAKDGPDGGGEEQATQRAAAEAAAYLHGGQTGDDGGEG